MLMPRPRKSETSTGATFATPGRLPGFRGDSIRPAATFPAFVTISTLDEEGGGRGEACVCVCVCRERGREGGWFGFDSNVYRAL